MKMNKPLVPDEKIEGVSVWGECGEFSMPASLRLALLRLAELYGWNPAGTDLPDPEWSENDGLGRDGGYYPPGGQRVTPEDAKDLDKALERAMVDIPDVKLEDDSFAGWLGEVVERH